MGLNPCEQGFLFTLYRYEFPFQFQMTAQYIFLCKYIVHTLHRVRRVRFNVPCPLVSISLIYLRKLIILSADCGP